MSLKIKLLLCAWLLAPAFLEAQLTQTFMLQNGFAPRKGEAFYQNGDLFFNHFTVGLTDNFSAGAGLMPTFLFEDRYINYTATLKFAVPVRAEKLNVALCLFHWGETYFDGAPGGDFVDEWGNVGTFCYGVATFGSRRKNVSVAAGGFFNYLFPDELRGFGDDEPYAPFPYLGASVYWQGDQRVAFVSENHLFSDGYSDYLLLSAGFRLNGRSAIFDLGFSATLDFYGGFFDAYPAPWLGVALPLGKRTRAMWRG